jgi:hypothetical protein
MFRRLRQTTIAFGTAGLLGCTASWNALVKYSPEPAAAWEEDGDLGVYAAVIREVARDWQLKSLHISDVSDHRPRLVVEGQTRNWIPGYWVDSLQQRVGEALLDSSMARAADRDDLVMVIRRLGLRHHAKPVKPFALDRRRQPLPAPSLILSRPGYDQQRTIATIRISFWCGPLCAHGATLILARRPGHRWRVWGSRLHWIS